MPKAPAAPALPGPPWRMAYPARLPDGRVLMLPIPALPGAPTHGVASLLVNQASFGVFDSPLLQLAADAWVESAPQAQASV